MRGADAPGGAALLRLYEVGGAGRQGRRLYKLEPSFTLLARPRGSNPGDSTWFWVAAENHPQQLRESQSGNGLDP